MRRRLIFLAISFSILSLSLSCSTTKPEPEAIPQSVTPENSLFISSTEGIMLSDSSSILNLTEALPDWQHTSLASGYTDFSEMEIYTSETVYGNHELTRLLVSRSPIA